MPDHLGHGVEMEHKAPCHSVDAIIHDEFQCLSSHIKHLMDSQDIVYVSHAPSKRPDPRTPRPGACFSTFVSRHVKPPPVQSYMNTLRDRMGHLVGQHWAAHTGHQPSTTPASPAVYAEHTTAPPPPTVPAAAPPPPLPFTHTPAPTPYAPSPGTVTVSPASTPAPVAAHHHVNASGPSSAPTPVAAPPHLPPSGPGPVPAPPPGLPASAHLSPVTPPHVAAPAVSVAADAAPSVPAPSVAPISSFTPPPKAAVAPPAKKAAQSATSSKPRMGTVKEPHKLSALAPEKAERTADVKPSIPATADGSSLSVPAVTQQQQAPDPAPNPAPAPFVANPCDSTSAANSLISQIKPDIFLSLVQMVQKNTLKFYIHVTEEEGQNQLCTEIKVSILFLFFF